MVLPGLQALFGFQLIAFFTETFFTRLGLDERCVHYAATALVVVAIGFVMGPAAFHRQAEPRGVSEHFVAVSSRLLMWGMFPLALGISLDVYVVGWLLIRSRPVAILLAAFLYGIIAVIWYALPRSQQLQRLLEGRKGGVSR
jgi:hypothetical protein